MLILNSVVNLVATYINKSLLADEVDYFRDKGFTAVAMKEMLDTEGYFKGRLNVIRDEN